MEFTGDDLVIAVKTGDIQKVRAYVKSGFDISASPRFTSIMWNAMYARNTEIMELIVAQPGVPSGRMFDTNSTPLEIAYTIGFTPMRILLAAKADIADDTTHKPLMHGLAWNLSLYYPEDWKDRMMAMIDYGASADLFRLGEADHSNSPNLCAFIAAEQERAKVSWVADIDRVIHVRTLTLLIVSFLT
jgi:hypothetical protein